jgi:peptide-methionine (S)-S-oxide reductase
MRTRQRLVAAVLWVLAAGLAAGGCSEDRKAGPMTAEKAADEARAGAAVRTATFGAGCFWGVEAAFCRVRGVVDTEVGYAGGDYDNPTYKAVCSGRTGHAEVVRVVFDPRQVTYEQLLEVFWGCHDPTTPNRQGPDVGAQYRSAIFTHSPAQAAAAEASKAEHQKALSRPIVTQIEPAGTFWPAEEYHQRYLEKRGRASCREGTWPSRRG